MPYSTPHPGSAPLEVRWSDETGSAARLRSQRAQSCRERCGTRRTAGPAWRRSRVKLVTGRLTMASTPTLEFEKPIVELEKQIDELKKLAGDQQLHVDEEIAPLEKKLTALRQEVYRNLSPLQRRAGGAEREASVHARLHPALLHRLHRAARRPAVPRRRGDRRRLGATRRRDGDGDRPPARPRHQGEPAAQLRHAAPGGISQGAPPDEAGREVPRAGVHVHRHAWARGPASAPRSAASRRRSRATCSR